MAEQIKPGLYKAEWTEEERDELYSLSDSEIEDLKDTLLRTGREEADVIADKTDADSDSDDSE